MLALFPNRRTTLMSKCFHARDAERYVGREGIPKKTTLTIEQILEEGKAFELGKSFFIIAHYHATDDSQLATDGISTASVAIPATHY